MMGKFYLFECRGVFPIAEFAILLILVNTSGKGDRDSMMHYVVE